MVSGLRVLEEPLENQMIRTEVVDNEVAVKTTVFAIPSGIEEVYVIALSVD